MSLAAGPKTGRTPLDLSGRPEDLVEARLWVLREFFGVRLNRWQEAEFRVLGAEKRPRLAYIQIARKNGKSFLIACFVLTEIILFPERHCYAVSDSERNLTSVLFLEIQQLIGRSERVSNALHVYQSKVQNPGNGSFLELRPGNFKASQGVNPHLVLFDEVHLQKSDQVWNGFIAAGSYRDDFLMIGTTTPGYDLASMAYDLYLKSKLGPEDEGFDEDFYGSVYEPSNFDADHRDPEHWAEGNPVALDEPRFLELMAKDLKLLPEHDFRRFRLGQWTTTSNAWLPYGSWDDLAKPRALKPGEKIWLGFDGSYSGDSTALVACTADLYVCLLGVWENAGDRDWRVPRGDVERVLASAFEKYQVQTLTMDKPYWEAELERWGKRWPRRVVDYPTGSFAKMAPATTSFYSAVMERRLSHDGDRRLARHITNAQVRQSPYGDTIAKANKWSPAKIDAAIAAILAVSSAVAGASKVLPPLRVGVA